MTHDRSTEIAGFDRHKIYNPVASWPAMPWLKTTAGVMTWSTVWRTFDTGVQFRCHWLIANRLTRIVKYRSDWWPR